MPQEWEESVLHFNIAQLASLFHQWCEGNAAQVRKNVPVLHERRLDNRAAKVWATGRTVLPVDMPFMDSWQHTHAHTYARMHARS